MTNPSIYDYYDDDELVYEGKTLNQLSELLGKTRQTISAWNCKNVKSKRIEQVGYVREVFELRNNEQGLIMKGTIDQIAAKNNFSREYVLKMNSIGRKDTGGKYLVKTGEFCHERFETVESDGDISEKSSNIRIVKAKKETWKPSGHSKLLFDYCFKGWEVSP